jgi:hypothetical protein
MASEGKGPSAIARLVLAQYDALPPRGKPQERQLVAFVMREQQSTQCVVQGPEWTVLAGVVASEGGEHAGKQRWADGAPCAGADRVIALATGTKCLGRSLRSRDKINDAHAEVLARRALRRCRRPRRSHAC